MPRPVQALVSVVIAARRGGRASRASLALAGEPLDQRRLRRGARRPGCSLAELFPIRMPGGAEETSFSTSFSFALLVTHGAEVTVLVSVACLLAADAIRRPRGGQGRLQRRAVRDLVGARRGRLRALAGPPERRCASAGSPSSPRWCPPAIVVRARQHGVRARCRRRCSRGGPLCRSSRASELRARHDGRAARARADRGGRRGARAVAGAAARRRCSSASSSAAARR